MKKNESASLKEIITKPLDTNNMKKYSKEEIQKGFEAWEKDVKNNKDRYNELESEESDYTRSEVLVLFMDNPNHTFKKQI